MARRPWIVPLRVRLTALVLLGATAFCTAPGGQVRARLAAARDMALAARQPRPALRTARTHPMQYYVSLPAGWNPAQRWPIVVTIDGADHNFQLDCQTFTRARGPQPFIIVTPFTLTNGGRRDPRDYHYAPDVWAAAVADPAAFDEVGVLAAIRDVQQDYQGEDKVFLTGFSAGGHLAWQLAFAHPERFAAVAFAAANYAGRGVAAISDAPERVTLPLRAFQGDQDPLRGPLEQQWASARALALAHGYTNLSRERVRGAGHIPFAPQSLAFFAAQRSSSQRTTAAMTTAAR